jgi:hypothetical protein
MPASRFGELHLVARRRTARWPAVALAAALLASCAAQKPVVALKPYAIPAGVPTARLLSRGAVTPGDIFGVFVFDDAVNCSGPRLAASGNATRAPKATEIEAGRTATLDFMVMRADKSSCRIRWSFTPVAGKTYLVAGALSGTNCSARVLDASDPDNIRPEGTAQRRNAGSASCTALVARSASAPFGGNDQAGEAVLRPGATADDLQGLIQP